MMAENQEASTSFSTSKTKVLRCMEWLQKQNSQEVKKSLRNKNDIQFIIQTNADRKNFLLAAADDDTSVPPGVGEIFEEPKAVPLYRLRKEQLSMECEWQGCRIVYSDYEEFLKHVKEHFKDLPVMNKDEDTIDYICLWDVCGHRTTDFLEMVRHINYHAYHAKLLAIGYNGRSTLKLPPCHKDSTKRNMLKNLSCPHQCMWIECNEIHNSVQEFFNHVKLHIIYSDKFVCSWAGCGSSFSRRVFLSTHVRGHTGERLIACYHCGQHFSNNRKLLDHLRRQNVPPNSRFTCNMCGIKCASQYLLDEHERGHVSMYACALCDMTAATPAALAIHVRYRHMEPDGARVHACTQCHYKAVTKSDLCKHLKIHERKRKRENRSDAENSEESEPEIKKEKVRKQYACHICPKNLKKVYSRGAELTIHLVKKHGAVWPFGYSRFRYQKCEDGMYRLTTTRYEYLEVSKKIVDGGPKKTLASTELDFTLEKTGEATFTTPTKFEIVLKGDNSNVKNEIELRPQHSSVEITMCDLDEKGNIVKSEILQSDVVFT